MTTVSTMTTMRRITDIFRLALVLVLVAGFGADCAGAELRAGKLGAEQVGMATHYSPRLAGHRTASGERYDPARLTAAHRSLPFSTWVKVTRLDGSGRSVVVRINDRCAGSRKIIDVSEAAARRLDMIKAGTVRVRIQVVAAPGRE